MFKFIIVFVWSYFWYFILCCVIVINIMMLGIEYSGGLFIAETVNYCTFRVPRFRSLKGLMDEITSDFCGPTISNSTYHISAHESVRFRHFIFSLFLGLFVKKSFNLLLKQTLHLQKTNILTLTGEAWYHSATYKTNKFKKIPRLLSQTRYRNTHTIWAKLWCFTSGILPKWFQFKLVNCCIRIHPQWSQWCYCSLALP